MSNDNLKHPNFQTHILNEEGKQTARDIGFLFDELLTKVQSYGGTPRELALVATHLEIACFFAKKSIATKPENQA